MGNILVNVKKHGFNLEEELWIGLWVGYVTELLDTPWSGCFATSTAFFKTKNWLKIIKNLCNVIDSAYYSYFDWGALLYYRCWGWLDHFCYGNGTLLGAVVGTQRTKRLEHTLSPTCLGNFVNLLPYSLWFTDWLPIRWGVFLKVLMVYMGFEFLSKWCLIWRLAFWGQRARKLCARVNLFLNVGY